MTICYEKDKRGEGPREQASVSQGHNRRIEGHHAVASSPYQYYTTMWHVKNFIFLPMYEQISEAEFLFNTYLV